MDEDNVDKPISDIKKEKINNEEKEIEGKRGKGIRKSKGS